MTRLHRTFSVNKVERPLSSMLRLPRMGISSPWVTAGLQFCANRRASHALQLAWGAIYAFCGAVQFVAGIYFMLELPIFQLGSNIWTGAWNCFSGVTIILLGCAGSMTTLKAQGFLLLSLVVAIVNLVNLVILEVGEWRGFLSTEDTNYIKEHVLDGLMYSAYLCTTISTVIAMIASFLASQYAFCFQQVLADREAAASKKSPSGNMVHHHNFDPIEDNDSLMPKDFVKRHDDDLNLKTPSGPIPHPTWIYRGNYAPFHSVARTVASTSTGGLGTNVKRSLSFLKATKSSSQEQNSPGIRTISETVDPISPAGGGGKLGGNRHAVIRRHQSMYIHPRATEVLPSFSANEVPTFNMHEASGKSEVRPIVTLKRSKTTVGQVSQQQPPMHYRGASTLQPPTRTFRSNSVAKQMKLFDHNHNVYGTNKRKSHHYSHFDDICEFQAGRSFDLPDREKMRRYGWSAGNITANGNCVLLETTDNSKSPYIRHAQEELSTDSCGENIRYQAVEGLVQSSRHKLASNSHLLRSAHYSSSMENLLSERSEEAVNVGMVKYGSTGSISSVGSSEHQQQHQQHHLKGILTNGRQASYTPSSLYSQDSSSVPTMYFGSMGKMSSSESVLIYDTVPRKGATVKKSNSRVSSTGKLRLRVESFRNNKSSSGTQTDISVVRASKQEEVEPNNNEVKYTGQFKKHAAPHKPARKHKPKSGGTESENRSDRSASPDNSSTSGYSSPSAGLHSKESSPCGSKIPSPPHSLEVSQGTNEAEDDTHDDSMEDHHDDSGRLLDESMTEEDMSEEDHRITVIQIENNGDNNDKSSYSESSSSDSPSPDPREKAPSEQPNFTRQTRRELPRIATNGTLSRATAGSAAPKRKLPDTRAQEMSQFHQQQQRLFQLQQQRMYNRPAPIHQFGPAAVGRVPLPPVPELERSDHERESMSPTPSAQSAPSPRTVQGAALAFHPPYRPLPSPLTTPVQPAIGRVQPKPRRTAREQLALSPSRIPRALSSEREAKPNVDEKLRVLLTLLESGREDAKNGACREDTLQYLSQLESVARRLKDQLMNKYPEAHLSNHGSDC